MAWLQEVRISWWVRKFGYRLKLGWLPVSGVEGQMQMSGVHGYAIVPATVRGALRQVRSEREDLDSQREALLGTMEDLMEATKMRAVTTALSSVWNDMIALQAEAAGTRIDNAVTGMEESVQAFEQGDATMMDSAQTSMQQSVVLEIDDGLTVEE